MAPTTSDEFEGDDFSNNLFSDLAPLLTLFGEQVTKQFLSMSMGWADNFLLAMGPLGIITTIVSAIRVGGGNRLKALIGRARESHPVAEQELLSSTSQNVCEMWSGQQIVRLIGSGEDMETFVISPDGEVSDLRTATNNGHPWVDRDMEQFLSRKNGSPNLTLNVQGATASKWELWAWAVLGIILQFFSIAFAGMATHYWKWAKPEGQVADYGYPCFCAGTTCLIIAIVACGHVIEGVTDETTLPPLKEGTRILALQKARTVGDQHFPSCAIFMTGKDGSLKFSRLNKKNYRLLVTISTSLAIVGYIVQFIGLRALHWSATIAQLGITLIMTAIRAWARRGLASDPHWHPLFEGHELASLALVMRYHHLDDIANASSAEERVGALQQPLYELISIYAYSSGNIMHESSFFPYHRPQTFLDFQDSNDYQEDIAILKVYNRILDAIPRSKINQEAADLSKMVFTVIGNVMDLLDASGVILWKGEASRRPSEQVATDRICWVFDIAASKLSGNSAFMRPKVSFSLRRDMDRQWTLLDHDLIAALLSLSAQLWATRLERVHQVTGRQRLSIGDELFFVDYGVPNHPSCSGRVVGNINNDDSSSNREMLEEWLDTEILSQSRSSRIDHELECYLGVFFMSCPNLDRWNLIGANNLVIQTRRDSALLLQWTQELFSIFMLAVASKVERVLGETEEVEGKRGPGKRRFKNSVFDAIADVAVKKGLAHDRDEAYTLIVPAFAKYGLLPTRSKKQEAENTLERPTSPAPSNSEENAP